MKGEYLKARLSGLYNSAVAATTLIYPDEVTDPSHFAALKNRPEPREEELALMTQIVDKLTVDYDLGAFHDSHKERIDAMIASKMKGVAVEVKEKGPKKPVAKSMMEALRKTLK